MTTATPRLCEYPLVYLEWDDSATVRGWQDLDDYVSGVMPCCSVGWEVRSNDTETVIVSDLGANTADDAPHTGGRFLTIPTRCVTRRTVLQIGVKRDA